MYDFSKIERRKTETTVTLPEIYTQAPASASRSCLASAAATRDWGHAEQSAAMFQPCWSAGAAAYIVWHGTQHWHRRDGL